MDTMIKNGLVITPGGRLRMSIGNPEEKKSQVCMNPGRSRAQHQHLMQAGSLSFRA